MALAAWDAAFAAADGVIKPAVFGLAKRLEWPLKQSAFGAVLHRRTTHWARLRSAADGGAAVC
jgi:hypothetical protein